MGTALTAGSTLVAGALLLNVSPAQASQHTGADRAIAAVRQATGTSDLARTTPWASSGETSTAAVNGHHITVRVPSHSTGAVTVTADDGTTVGVSFVRAKNVTGTADSSGTVTYPAATPSSDIAVQPTADGGARLLTVLNDAAASHVQRFRFTLPSGSTLVSDSRGGYNVVRQMPGGASIQEGHVDPAWAKDNAGRSVPTSYAFDGSVLTQTVDTNADTAYPVVADPKFSWGWVTGTVYFNRSETERLALGATAAAAIINQIPAPDWVKHAVLGYLPYIVYKAGVANQQHACVKVKVPTLSAGVYNHGDNSYCA